MPENEEGVIPKKSSELLTEESRYIWREHKNGFKIKNNNNLKWVAHHERRQKSMQCYSCLSWKITEDNKNDLALIGILVVKPHIFKRELF